MVTVFAHSEVGDRHVNEDAWAVQPHPSVPELWLGFVADGQGGFSGGGEAARLACETGLRLAELWHPDELLAATAWAELLHRVDEVVRADAMAGLTTLVGVGVHQGRIVGASHGDSAALLVAAGTATELTTGQHRRHPIGSGDALATPFVAAVSRPWRLVLMTDGAWKYAGWGRVVELARESTGSALIQRLRDAASLPATGKLPDDFTVVVLDELAATVDSNTPSVRSAI